MQKNQIIKRVWGDGEVERITGKHNVYQIANINGKIVGNIKDGRPVEKNERNREWLMMAN
jgi:hypothetical protein